VNGDCPSAKQDAHQNDCSGQLREEGGRSNRSNKDPAPPSGPDPQEGIGNNPPAYRAENVSQNLKFP
jgi:hypothetical protein